MGNRWKVKAFDLWVTSCDTDKYCVIDENKNILMRGFASFDAALDAAVKHEDTLNVHISKTASAPNYIRVKGQLYKKAETMKSDLEVMAADFGILPEHLNDLKKYTDDTGLSLYDAVARGLK